MPAYAATPTWGRRRRHPRALVLIVAGHAVLLAAVMSGKMDLPDRLVVPTPTEVELIPLPKDPPPPEPQPSTDPNSSQSRIDRPQAIVPIPQPRIEPVPIPLPFPDPGAIVGPGVDPPRPGPAPVVEPVRVGPRFATPESKVRPPYPPSKVRTEEEAALKLRLSIDARGRVTAVEPVGRADRAFLDAARRHLIAHWRYRPATEDGMPIASSTVITLRFELTG